MSQMYMRKSDYWCVSELFRGLACNVPCHRLFEVCHRAGQCSGVAQDLYRRRHEADPGGGNGSESALLSFFRVYDRQQECLVRAAA